MNSVLIHTFSPHWWLGLPVDLILFSNNRMFSYKLVKWCFLMRSGWNWRSFLAIFKPQKCLNILLVKQLEWISSIPWDRKSKWVLEMHLSGSLKYTCILEIVCIDSKKQQQQKKKTLYETIFHLPSISLCTSRPVRNTVCLLRW